MDRVVVSDTNIFIDLVDIGLEKALFDCGLEIHTTQMVIDEVRDDRQRRELLSHPGLVVRKYGEADYEALFRYYVQARRHSNLSVTDCSVLLYARELGCTLLTNDGKLRNVAMREGIEVMRLLSIIMYMVERGRVDVDAAKSALERLLETNSRAPVELVMELLGKLEHSTM